MFSLLLATMSVGEIILVVACVAIVLGVVVSVIARKLNGKPACCDECSGNCASCQASKNHENEDNFTKQG